MLTFLPWTIIIKFIFSPSSADADPASETITLELVDRRLFLLCC